MSQAFLELPGDVQQELWRHLVRPDSDVEQAALVFTRDGAQGERRRVLRCVEWLPVSPDGFVIQSSSHIELTDVVRGAVIKRAHDLSACLVEFHFHAGPWPAAFSPSDFAGFHEFVPHVLWRLKGRPYVAVVVARSGFDALAWLQGPHRPERLGGLIVDREICTPTGLTPLVGFDHD